MSSRTDKKVQEWVEDSLLSPYVSIQAAGTDLGLDASGNLETVAVDAGISHTSTWTHTASADMSSTAALTAAPTTGQYIVVDDVLFSTDTEMNFTFEIETAGTDNVIVYVAANTTIQFTPRGKWKLATADKKLHGKASAAGNVAITVWYHSEA